MHRTITLFNQEFSFREGNHIGKGDSGFVSVKIPHDYIIGRDIGEEFAGKSAQGFFDCFHALTYRKEFCYFKQKDEYCYLLFEGVFRNSEVYLNGQLLGNRPSGYVSFSYELTKYLRDGNNVLEIYVDNSTPPSDRWYTGMGIYRDIYFISTGPVHIAIDGTYITTPLITKEKAVVKVEYELVGDVGKNVSIQTTILLNENVVARAEVTTKESVVSQSITVPKPHLWDINDPQLYQMVSRVFVFGGETDSYTTTFGIRDIHLDLKEGLILNGRSIKLKGVNLHHTSGCLGAAFYEDVWKRTILKLKEIGINAIRCSHNPQAPGFYNLCDKYGILVYDEAFDKWHWEKSYIKNYFDAWWQKDLEAMIKRDRNHPCIFIWSVGNEIANQGEKPMIEELKKLTSFVKSYEPSRPVTIALKPLIKAARKDNHNNRINHCVMTNMVKEIAQYVDVISCNYQEQWYAYYKKAIPNKLIIGSEVYNYYTATEGSDFFNNLEKKHPFSYVKENNYVIGSFYWAGVDYLGESFGYPCKGWTASILDSTGADRPFTAQSRALFRPNIPFVSFAVLDEKQPFEYASSTWSFPKSSSHMMIDRKYGEIVQVITFTTCESVELIVGDRSYGEKYLLEYRDSMIPWNIVWEKKQVTMIGKNHGNEVCRQIVNVFDEPFTFDVQFNKNKLSDYIHDLCFIEIQILDQDLRPNYNADTLLSISLSDELELLGVDNGDLCSHHNYKGHELRVYKGKGLVIVRGRKKGVGTVQIQAPELSTIKKVEIKVFPSTQQ